MIELLPSYIRERIGPESDEGCWPWLGHVERNGYGRITTRDPLFSGDGRPVHLEPTRVIWEFSRGPVPDGAWVSHSCHERAVSEGTCTRGVCAHRACVSPSHLFLGHPSVRRGLSRTA